MEIYRTEDNHVAKYVHDDGSETAIKTTPIDEFGGIYGKVTNKYNIFISISVGCPVGCKFCYLTVKKCPYHKIEIINIKNNVIAALKAELKVRPELHNMYTKLSWMGMGDAFLDTNTMYWATLDIMDTIKYEGLSRGIDGIDVATTMPCIQNVTTTHLETLRNIAMGEFDLNPLRNTTKPIRVFYSLHSANNATRKSMIPMALDVTDAIDYLVKLNSYGITTILHHMFFNGINDSDEEIKALIRLLQNKELKNIELRLLRFNQCEGTSFIESTRFDTLVEQIYKHHKNIKVQSSPGSEVKAACGQFLLSNIKSNIV